MRLFKFTAFLSTLSALLFGAFPIGAGAADLSNPANQTSISTANDETRSPNAIREYPAPGERTPPDEIRGTQSTSVRRLPRRETWPPKMRVRPARSAVEPH